MTNEFDNLPLGERIKAKRMAKELKESKPRKKRPTAVNNKARGYRLEKLIVDMAKRMGINACRAWGSNGRALGYTDDIDGELGGFLFQAKMKKDLPKWLRIPVLARAVIFRTDFDTPKCLIELSWYLELLKTWELWWSLPANRKPANDSNL
jgi:hypothetical protein